MSKIKCKICNEEKGSQAFGAHVKRIHNVEFKDYLEQHYDTTPTDFPRYGRCGVCNVLTKKNGKTYIACCTEHSGILKSEYSKGRKAWNEGLTKDTNESLNKMSQTRKKQGNFKEGFKFTDESKQKMSTTRITKGLSKGKNNPMFGKTHTPEAVRKIFNHRKMNKLEQLVADTLDANNIEYYFQFFITENDVCKSYDFKLKGQNIIIEVDGDFWHGNPKQNNHWKDVDKVQDNDKLKTKLAEDRGFTLLRFWESDIKNNPNIILEHI